MSVRLKKSMPIPSRGQICFAQLFSEHPDKQDYFLCDNVFTPTDSTLEEGDCVAVISFGNKTNERTNERTNPFQEILLKHFFSLVSTALREFCCHQFEEVLLMNYC